MATNVSGTISVDTTWSGEILVQSALYVPQGVTLTVAPGTIVRFEAIQGYTDTQIGLEVDGRLIADGTLDNRIWFTSASATPRNGDWGMIRLNGNTQSSLKFAVVEFAQQGVNIFNSDLLIENSVVRWHNWEGLYIEGNSTPTITGNFIYQNGYNGIAMEQFNTAILENNIVEKNGSHGIHIDASTATLTGNIFAKNGFSGISLDNNSTIVATNNASINNQDKAFAVGEGDFSITLSGNRISPNVENSDLTAAQVSQNGAETGPLDIAAVRGLDLKPYDLGYTPSDQVLDTYQYVFPDDASRQISEKLGAGLGLTWSVALDGDTIWTSDLSGHISQIDIATGTILKSLTAPSVQPWGMVHDGSGLWITDFAEKRTYKIDTNTGNELMSFNNPVQEVGAKGVAWDGTHLYLMGWGDTTIYQMTTAGALVREIKLSGEGGGGITWTGDGFWVSAQKKIVKYDMNGNQLEEIFGGSEVSWDLAWSSDNNLLWATQRTNENWFDDARIFGLSIIETQNGTAGANVLTGTKNLDTLNGLAGADVLQGGGSNDTIDGGDGIDTVVFTGKFSDYTIVKGGNGTYTITDKTADRDGQDTVVNTELYKFSDQTVAVDALIVIDWRTDISSIEVAASTYQFFIGTVPSVAGFEFLVASPGNNADLNDAFYAQFNTENRFINFANNLGSFGDGKDAFAAKYGSMTLEQTIQSAFEEIISSAAVTSKGGDPQASLDFFNNSIGFYTAIANERVVPSGVSFDQAVKVVAIGSILNEAMKANLGLFSDAIDAMTNEITTTGTSTSFGMDLLP